MGNGDVDVDDLEADDVSLAPESGQPRGGPDNPWDEVEAPSDDGWPPPRHASPNEEL